MTSKQSNGRVDHKSYGMVAFLHGRMALVLSSMTLSCLASAQSRSELYQQALTADTAFAGVSAQLRLADERIIQARAALLPTVGYTDSQTGAHHASGLEHRPFNTWKSQLQPDIMIVSSKSRSPAHGLTIGYCDPRETDLNGVLKGDLAPIEGLNWYLEAAKLPLVPRDVYVHVVVLKGPKYGTLEARSGGAYRYTADVYHKNVGANVFVDSVSYSIQWNGRAYKVVQRLPIGTSLDDRYDLCPSGFQWRVKDVG